MKHRGEILEKVVRNSKISLTRIAEAIGYNRTSIYNHFKEPDLDFGILFKYGRALEHDFTVEFPEMSSYMALFTEPPKDKKALSLGEAQAQIDYWRDKYINLLEKYNELILSKLSN